MTDIVVKPCISTFLKVLLQPAITCGRDPGCKQKVQSKRDIPPFGKVSSIGKGVFYISNGEVKSILRQITLS